MNINWGKVGAALGAIIVAIPLGVSEYLANRELAATEAVKQETLYATKRETDLQHLREERDDADQQAKSHAETAYHYCSLVDEGTADQFEAGRCRYSRERAEHFQSEVKRYQERIDNMTFKAE